MKPNWVKTKQDCITIGVSVNLSNVLHKTFLLSIVWLRAMGSDLFDGQGQCPLGPDMEQRDFKLLFLS